MSRSSCIVAIACEELRKKPLTITEIKDSVNSDKRCKYGTTSLHLRSILVKYKDIFQKIPGGTTVNGSGCYSVDKWWLKDPVGGNGSCDKLKTKTNTKTRKIKPANRVKKIERPVPPKPEPESKPKPEVGTDPKPVRKEMPKRMTWTDELKKQFLFYRVRHGMTQRRIAMTMGLRLTQVKGAQKDYKAGLYDRLIDEMKRNGDL
jgi:hypothetical protein